MRRCVLAAAAWLPPMSAVAADDGSYGPALQCLRHDSVWILWQAPRGGSGILEYGPAGGSSERLVDETAWSMHRFHLTNLIPGTRYTYTCSVGERPEVEPRRGSFATPPVTADRPVSFFVCGDTGATVAQLPGNLELLFARIRARDPAFVIHCGDVTETADFVGEFFKPWKSILNDYMMYLCLGNHDMLELRPTAFTTFAGNVITRDDDPNTFEETYYAVDWGPLHIVVLETVISLDALDRWDEQIAWLARDYETSRDRPWRILVAHVPPYTRTVEHATGSLGIEPRLTKACEEYRFDVGFFGHMHSYQRSHPIRGGTVCPTPFGRTLYRDQDAPIYVTVTSGWKLYTFKDRIARWCAESEIVLNYLAVDATDRAMTIEAFRLLDGSSIDSFTLEKTRRAPAPGLPVFTRVAVERMGRTQGVIAWETDRPTEGEVWIDFSTIAEPVGPYEWSPFTTLHENLVEFLGPPADAQFRIVCRDVFGAEAATAGHRFPLQAMLLRGDSNMDGVVDLADAIAVLYLAFGGPVGGIPCAAAGDVNGDDAFNVADAVSTLGFLFRGGPPPRAPYPEPGPLTAEERLPCPGGFYYHESQYPWW